MLFRSRNFGVGADGILYGPFEENGKWKVRIFNPDGSEAESSGNGIRIFAKYLLDEGYVSDRKITLETVPKSCCPIATVLAINYPSLYLS